MTVLVTGGAGYIGSHMVHALAEAGESVVVIDNLLEPGFPPSCPKGVPLFLGDAGAENLVEGVIAQHGIESIIHFAGSVVVSDSMRDPLAYYRNNTMTTRSLLNAAREGRRQTLHLFLDRCGLRRSRPGAGARARTDPSAVALRFVEADDRDHAARRRRRPRHELRCAALLQRRGLDRRDALDWPPSARRICSRSRSRPPPSSAPRSTCSAPIIRRTEAASATSFTSAT